MLSFILEEAIKDYVFFENDENLNLLENYVESLNSDNESTIEELEVQLFEVLDYYLYKSLGFYEHLLVEADVTYLHAVKKDEKKDDEKEKKEEKKKAQPLPKFKGGISNRIKGRLGISSFRKEVKSIYKNIKKKVGNKLKATELAKKARNAARAGIKNIRKKQIQAKKMYHKLDATIQKAKKAGAESKRLRDLRRRRYLALKAASSGNKRMKGYKKVNRILKRKK